MFYCTILSNRKRSRSAHVSLEWLTVYCLTVYYMTYFQNTNSFLLFKGATRNVLELLKNIWGLRIVPNWPLRSWTVKSIWFICQCAKITAGNHNLEEVLQLQWCNTSLSLCEMPHLTLLVFIMDRISSHKSTRQASPFLITVKAKGNQKSVALPIGNAM